MSLLEQNNTRKRQVEKNATELDAGNKGRKYKVEAIQNSAIYVRKSEDHLSGL